MKYNRDDYGEYEKSADDCKILFDMLIGLEKKCYAKSGIDNKPSKTGAKRNCSAEKNFCDNHA